MILLVGGIPIKVEGHFELTTESPMVNFEFNILAQYTNTFKIPLTTEVKNYFGASLLRESYEQYHLPTAFIIDGVFLVKGKIYVKEITDTHISAYFFTEIPPILKTLNSIKLSEIAFDTSGDPARILVQPEYPSYSQKSITTKAIPAGQISPTITRVDTPQTYRGIFLHLHQLISILNTSRSLGLAMTTFTGFNDIKLFSTARVPDRGWLYGMLRFNSNTVFSVTSVASTLGYDNNSAFAVSLSAGTTPPTMTTFFRFSGGGTGAVKMYNLVVKLSCRQNNMSSHLSTLKLLIGGKLVTPVSVQQTGETFQLGGVTRWVWEANFGTFETSGTHHATETMLLMPYVAYYASDDMPRIEVSYMEQTDFPMLVKHDSVRTYDYLSVFDIFKGLPDTTILDTLKAVAKASGMYLTFDNNILRFNNLQSILNPSSIVNSTDYFVECIKKTPSYNSFRNVEYWYAQSEVPAIRIDNGLEQYTTVKKIDIPIIWTDDNYPIFFDKDNKPYPEIGTYPMLNIQNKTAQIYPFYNAMATPAVYTATFKKHRVLAFQTMYVQQLNGVFLPLKTIRTNKDTFEVELLKLNI